jgi:iron complex outermembrane receptor protein
MKYDLDEIEVSAQRAPALYSQVARIISVMESKEIEAAPVESVQDLLEYIAGVDVRQRGTEGVQADVSIRGGTFDQMLILLNGINITDPQTGHHNLNLPVGLHQIERIEVLEGPAARVYGPNAFSGAINIVTKEPVVPKVSVAGALGSFGYFDANLSGNFFTGSLKHMVALNRKKSDGYVDNTDFKISDVFYTNVLESEKRKFTFQLGAADKGFGANSFYTPKYPNQYEETKTLFMSAKWASSSKIHLTPVVYWRRHQDRFELFRENPPSWYTKHNYHLTNVYGANLNSWVRWKWGKTAVGVEFRSENILSNVLGENLSSTQKVPGEDAVFTKSKSREIYSGFLEHTIYQNNLIISAGLMSNYISGSNLGINLFPGIEASYKIQSGLKIFGSYNASLRMPTFTDLYYSGPTNEGNPDLKPEKAATLEGGLKINHKFIQGQWAVFYRRGKNIIDLVKNANEDLWQPQNLTLVNSLGTELQTRFNLQHYAGNNAPDNVMLSFFYNHLEKINRQYTSNYVLDNLRFKFTGSLNQPIVRGLSINVKVSYQKRDGTYTLFENGDWGNEVEYRPFWLTDAKIRYNYRNLTLFALVSNLFDITYNDIGNVEQPGRWFKAGLTYNLNFN